MIIPVDVVEEGELTFNVDHIEVRYAGTGDNDHAYEGGSLIKNIALPHYGCLGVNAQYQGSYRLLSAAHVLTQFDRDNIGKEIFVRNDKGKCVPIGATVSGQVDVELYDSPEEPNPKYTKQDLAWADITRREGSPKIKNIGIPGDIRKVIPEESVKFYAGGSDVVGSRIEAHEEKEVAVVEDTIAAAKIKEGTTFRTRYIFFIDICRFERPEKLKYGDSGTAIVAENDNALLGILIAESTSRDSNAHYFCKLEVEN